MSEKRIANVEPIPLSVSKNGGERLWDRQYQRLQDLRAYQKAGFTHASIGRSKEIRIERAIRETAFKCGGVCGLEEREERADEGRS